jgi:coenzyme F420-0:L-glutamate ligase / coenzyme F420-1:gamma-L-glutamate ligase
LATADAARRPHVVPVCFALASGRVYTPLDEKPKRVDDAVLRRVQDIVANPLVCLLVDRYSENWERLAWLQLRGRAALIQPGADDHTQGIAALRARYPQYRSMELERRPVVEIRPERIVSWRVNGGTNAAQRGGAI